MRNLSRKLKSSSWSSALILPQPCLLLFVLAPFSPSSAILSAAERAAMAEIEQVKKTVPFVRCEISFGHFVCD